MNSFERLVDPAGKLTPAERLRRAEAARKAAYARLRGSATCPANHVVVPRTPPTERGSSLELMIRPALSVEEPIRILAEPGKSAANKKEGPGDLRRG
jgi:hypothetical protein